MIIWDEFKYGETIYKTQQVKTRKWQYKELGCLVKYLLSIDKKPKEIREILENCCQDDIKYLKTNQKRSIFDKIISKAKREKFIRDVTITVYQSEIDMIKKLNNKNLEKIMFVLLVYDKWLDNMNWFSLMRQDISREAKIGTINAYKQQELVQQLYELGYLKSDVKVLRNKHSKSGELKRQMWNIPFIQEEGDIAFQFNNYINVVNRYLNYVYGGFFECKRCGGMFKHNKWDNKIYCDECKKYQPIDTKIIYCVDCGRQILVDSKDNQTVRCDECQHKHWNEYNAMKQREYYKKRKSV